MNPLQEAIALMEKEDVRAFKLYANRTEKDSGRQDLALFDFVRSEGAAYSDQQAFEELYEGASKNTFHRLKSRLLSDINRSLVNQYLEKYDALRLYHFMMVVEFYLQKRHYELAHWFLRKAERLAVKTGSVEMLDIIYTEFIRLSQEGLVANPEEYVAKRKENQVELQRLRTLDDVLVMVLHRVKVTQTYGSTGAELMDLLQQTVAEFASEGTVRQSPKFRFRMFDAIAQILLDRRDFENLEIYCRATYEEFEADGLFSRSNHRTKLQMLTYLINSLQKNGKFEDSLYYARRLHAAMKAHDRMLYDQFLVFYYNALVVAYFQVDLEKALDTLRDMQQSAIIMDTPFYAMFVFLNLALVYNELKQYRESVRNFVQIKLLPGYKTAGQALQLRMLVAELMVRYELGEYEVLQQKLRLANKEFGELLKAREFRREKAMLRFIDRMNEAIEPQKEEQLKKRARRFVSLKPVEEQVESELIGYGEFIKKHFGFVERS